MLTAMKCSTVLATRLRKWRRAKGYPLKSVAYGVGVSEAAVSDWENGKRFPTGKHLDALAEHTGIPARCLLCANADKCKKPPSDKTAGS